MSKSFEIKVSVHYLKKSGAHIWRHYATEENVYIPTMEPHIISIEEQGLDHDRENHTEDRLGEEGDLYMYNLQDNPYCSVSISR